MDTADRIADVMRRPGAYEIRNLEQAIAFFAGFDAATGFVFLDGFREWLSRNGGAGPNLTWAYQVSRVVASRAGEEEQVGEFFTLVREFLAATR
ncbi:hypothetical protein [Amycolatopsis solani]|uniref:hypothetical protein n=1 Tax=Amycolatopsis solani TaxID=3028615 RepID=UPI0025B1E342|nr:hypothetical protein [Amycolatopsis sp. MEP2-6]